MNVEHLVHMANQIEDFFRSEPDRSLAIEGIAVHLKRYWDPRMRTALVAHVADGGAGLGELATAALLKLGA
jgi:formate dehydrogenase subunit delta